MCWKICHLIWGIWWFHRSKDFEAMKAGKLAIRPWLSCPYNKNMLVDLPSFVLITVIWIHNQICHFSTVPDKLFISFISKTQREIMQRAYTTYFIILQTKAVSVSGDLNLLNWLVCDFLYVCHCNKIVAELNAESCSFYLSWKTEILSSHTVIL